MLIGIRVDSSNIIGVGHVYRCLTLANALSKHGNEVVFMSKQLPGNLISKIIECGFDVRELNNISNIEDNDGNIYGHQWLGCSIEDDLKETEEILGDTQYDWIIIDHYGLNAYWECGISQHTNNLMIIDDLNQRHCECDLYFNQNLIAQDINTQAKNYCLGPKFALLRNEFKLMRDESLISRNSRSANNIIISMGGVDKDNLTLLALESVREQIRFMNTDVVMGSTALHTRDVRNYIKAANLNCNLHIDTSNMAKLMMKADIAIAACGTSSFERCVMGLPMLNFIAAENQRDNAEQLQEIGAARTVWDYKAPNYISMIPDMLEELINDKIALGRMSKIASEITEGDGVNQIVDKMYDCSQ